MKNRSLILFALATGGLAALAGSAARTGGAPSILTTLEDFFLPGSQPSGDVVYDSFVTSNNCRVCHTQDADGDESRIYSSWQGSVMAQAGRDPLFYACLAVANQDAAFAGDMCIRCHMAGGWISGRSEPADGSSLTQADRDGVSCSVCHRMVDPVLEPGVSPPIDESILVAINPLPVNPGGGNLVLDPEDRRRGPYSDPAPPGHLWLASQFMRSATLCATCHDVSNPAYMRQADGTYQLTELNEPHPTGDKYDMVPIERTYSEWLMSDFAKFGVDLGGLFGGNIKGGVVSTCQDCHMPKFSGRGCIRTDAPVRDDLAAHDFSGGNTVVQDMVLNLYPDENVVAQNLADGKQRSIEMLQRACDLEVEQFGYYLNVRIINQTGHKLPSGYPEGRRIWINVQQRDARGDLILELGSYNALTADLTTEDTKVYEAHYGIDEAVSRATGIPVDEPFHFVLNNVVLKDNRIPPRGFTNEAFAAIQASPVRAVYADGQYWDDTRFRLAPGAVSATATIQYQTISKEYVEFLRDENHTNDAGEILYDQWMLTGRSAPIAMAGSFVQLLPFADGDGNADGAVDDFDFALFADCVTGPDAVAVPTGCTPFDLDGDTDIDFADFAALQYLIAPY